ncbi:helix-turn-helix domain-containing protein [Actinophytocola xanthii]|uniref:HTH cro/C1-type domain-containing protein n=1 Tax=Actinophytocola xanthii TaxID=1912961 RepID=A0A1Q8C1L7_9PSEU|nr:helix-turn-helix transcriptional regulator [Actinophytocola xanthii]OLF08260.1 hypothetical protein BU204_34610 [Actinophytocola xanthii]
MGRTNATACHRELGAELKKRREAAGLTGQQVAEHTGWHRTKVSRVESGHYAISPVELIHYLAACGIHRPREFDDLTDLCRQAQRDEGYWIGRHAKWMEETGSSLIFHESTAVQCVTYEPVLVPGLLQTAGYARAALSRRSIPPAEVETLVRTRLDRQQVLYRKHRRPFAFFVHEQALRFLVGSRSNMHDQLLHLVLIAGLPHVNFRVIPTTAGVGAILGGAFRLFEFDQHHPLVFLDGITAGLFLEDEGYVQEYRSATADLDALALDAGESRAFAAELADAYDRGSRRNAPIYQLEEEHF